MKLVVALLLAGLSPLIAQDIVNGGFEADLSDWEARVDRGMSEATAEAARTGKLGLRVTDESESQGSGLFSLPTEVHPDSEYELSWWARGVSGSGGVGIYLRFLDENGKMIGKEKMVSSSSEIKEWKQYSIKAKAPERAVTAQIWIHSFAKDMPVLDLDDFSLKEIAPSN